MDWSKSKSIFIITFLFLNVFLTWQLVEKNNANQISTIAQATIQERLTENQVSIDVELPEAEMPGVHLVGKKIEWTTDMLSGLPPQEFETIEPTVLISELLEPYEISEEQTPEEIMAFVSQYVYGGEQYRPAPLNVERMQRPLFQQYEGYTTFTYDDDQLILFYNEDFDIIGYQQTVLEFEQQGREHDMVTSLQAIEVLLNNQHLRVNHSVVWIQFGYHSLVSQQGDVQVFAPMWQILVNDGDGENELYLVNAINGDIQ